MNDVSLVGPNAERVPRGITRHEYGRAQGWLARVYRLVEGVSSCVGRRLFSDGVYGGRAEALAAAIAWREAELESLPVARAVKRVGGYGYVRRAWRRRKTASGVAREYEVFEANVWDHEGNPASTAWSIERHGESEARARCEAWLAEKRHEMRPPLDRCG